MKFKIGDEVFHDVVGRRAQIYATKSTPRKVEPSMNRGKTEIYPENGMDYMILYHQGINEEGLDNYLGENHLNENELTSFY